MSDNTDEEDKPAVDVYELSDIEEVSAALNRAMRALDQAEWELERLGYGDEHRVTRMLRHDLRIVRMLVEEKEKGNTDFQGYHVEHDRFMQLVRRAPGED